MVIDFLTRLANKINWPVFIMCFVLLLLLADRILNWISDRKERKLIKEDQANFDKFDEWRAPMN